MFWGVSCEQMFEKVDELLATSFWPRERLGQFDEGVDIKSSEGRTLLEELADGLADLADASGDAELG